MSLSETLRDSGQTLMLVEGEKPKASSEKTQMRELVQAVLEDLGKPWLTEKSSIEGDCLIPASRDDLFIAVSRILQWFAYRLVESLPGDWPFLRIVCDTPPEGARITFEDGSPRLPARLRQRLFSPFAQPIPAARGEAEGAGLHFPLYLAKTLVELKQGGMLEDRSDDLPGKAGHRFVIRFPNRH
jgi:signal transduction histidine kinase